MNHLVLLCASAVESAVVWELKFGSWVLLQPGRINAYAQAVIQTMRADEHERGCLAEERVLGGDLTCHRPEERLPADEERFVLLAMRECRWKSGETNCVHRRAL